MSKSVRIFWTVFFYCLAAIFLLVLLINFGLFGPLPSLKEVENPSIMLASEVYSDDGTLMGKYYKDKSNRSMVEYKDISQNVIHALLATEDKRFYKHSGIDGWSLLRAIVKFGRDGGGSTITQQLAKYMLGQGSKNKALRIIEKIKESIVAIKLERNLTKEEILALYLNAVSFGDNVFGIRNASRTFFQKEPDRLTVDQAAVLIAMLSGNNLYNPRRNPKAAIERRNLVINRMADEKYLSPEEASNLKLSPIELNYRKLDENNGYAPYFLDVIRDELKKWCKDHKNLSTGEPYDLYEDGLKIYTTINIRMQLYAEEGVAKQMPILQKAMNAQAAIRRGTIWNERAHTLESYIRNSDRWNNLEDEGMSNNDIRKTFSVPVHMRVFAWNSMREKDTVMTPLDSIKYHRQMLQTSFLAMDPLTGAVKVWIGGIDFKNYKYDHVNINTKRQVGSAIKPLLYADAIEEVGFTPETPVKNQAQYFARYGMVPASGICKGDGGSVTMSTALAYSLNCASAYIMKQVTAKRFVKFLKHINIQSPGEPYPSICLGAIDLSIYEMLWAYSMFPSGGYSTKPYYISRIEDKNGNLLASFDTKRKKVINENTAYTMCRMMQGPVDVGTAAGLRERLGLAEMGGKTGTTNDNTDAWFIGYTPQLLAGAWIGCDDQFIHLDNNLGMGSQAARPIWEYFFAKALADNTLGLNRHARFAPPEIPKNDILYDYAKIIERTPPPGAEGYYQSHGNANHHIDTSPPLVPVDSKPTVEEVNVWRGGTTLRRSNKQGSFTITVRDADKSQPPKKKRSFFKRLFGGKEK
jgi:penicillin-binding protein 1A